METIDVKVYFENVVRRFSISRSSTSYGDISSIISKVFKLPSSIDQYIVQYKDEEGDMITLGSTSDEFEECKRCVGKGDILRVFITPKTEYSNFHHPRNRRRRFQPRHFQNQPQNECMFQKNPFSGLMKSVHEMFKKSMGQCEEEKIDCKEAHRTHYGIVCDGCTMSNFVGNRFKCQDCKDYDLCDKCHPNRETIHPNHNFKLIDKPIRYPPCIRKMNTPPQSQDPTPQSPAVSPDPEPAAEKKDEEKMEKTGEGKETHKYQKELNFLHTMGFSDDEMLKKYLEQSGGKVDRVVDMLIRKK